MSRWEVIEELDLNGLKQNQGGLLIKFIKPTNIVSVGTSISGKIIQLEMRTAEVSYK